MVTVCPSQFATRRTLFHVLVGCGLLMLKVSRLKLPVIWLLVSMWLNTLTKSQRSEERFSRNAETDLVCRLLLEKKKKRVGYLRLGIIWWPDIRGNHGARWSEIIILLLDLHIS